MKKEGGQCRYLWGSGKPSPQPRVSVGGIGEDQEREQHWLKKSKLPESGVGGHSRGGVPFKTPSDEVGEQGVLAT